jgi:hypothetical protein
VAVDSNAVDGSDVFGSEAWPDGPHPPKSWSAHETMPTTARVADVRSRRWHGWM